jgi:hypothetical protein
VPSNHRPPKCKSTPTPTKTPRTHRPKHEMH